MLLPLSFLSGLFPFGMPRPEAVRVIAGLFPLQHFGEALGEAMSATSLAPVTWWHLAVLLVWALLAALPATRLLAPAGRIGRAGPPRPGPTG